MSWRGYEVFFIACDGTGAIQCASKTGVFAALPHWTPNAVAGTLRRRSGLRPRRKRRRVHDVPLAALIWLTPPTHPRPPHPPATSGPPTLPPSPTRPPLPSPTPLPEQN